MRDLPVIPKLPESNPHDLVGNPAVAKCGECGRIIHRVEGYCCMNARCPVQPKGTC